MKQRSIAAVVIFTLITCGIYSIYWFVATKSEMVTRGATIPTAWLLIIPIANIYWMWKWSEGVEHVTRGKQSTAVNFILIYLLSVVGMAIIQSFLNKAVDDYADLPQARVA